MIHSIHEKYDSWELMFAPGKRTTFGLPDGGYCFEKRFAFAENPGHPSHGKLKGSQSFSSMDEPGVGTQYPIQEITYDYDALERLALEEIVFNPDGIGSSATPDLLSRIHYSDYNYRGSLLRRAVDVNQDGVIDLTYFYTYDNWNRMQSIHLALGNATDATGASKIVSYEYDDALGLLTQRNLFSQQGQTGNDTQINAVNYKYDVRDRMYIQSSELMYYQLYYDDQSVGTDSWGEPVAQSFNHNGNINGTRTVYNWDHTTMPSNAGMEGALLYGYQYDRLNRLLRADAIVEDYVATQSGSNLYNCYGIGDVNVNYDPVGNIRQILRTLPETYAMGTLQLQHLNFAVGSTHNQVSEVTDLFTGPRVFTYDVNGNLISDSKNGVLQTDIGRSSYPYQLKGIHPATSESIQYTYLYDTDDSRIFKRVEKGSALQMEYYLKDIGVYDMTSDKWTYFVQGDDRIAKVFPQNYQSPGQNAANTDLKVSQGMANFYEYDHLGNTRIVYSVRDIHNGTTNFDIHFAADYYPYGKTLRYFETAAFEEKFLTTQHERDRETGFDYRGARYYDADLGRFLSLDPLAAQYPAWSDYVYVLGNPVMYIDPDGRESKETRWTKNHVLMNQAFGGSSGLNDLIEEQCDDCPDKTFQMENAPEPYEVKQYNFEASPFRSRAERDAHNNRIDHQIAQRNLMNGPMRQFILIGDGLQIGSAALPTGQVGGLLKLEKLGRAWNALRTSMKGSNVVKGGVQYSDDLVKSAQEIYPKLAGKTQLHHITPKYLGGAKNGPLVPLDGAYHQMITNEFRALWGYGKGIPSATELKSIMKQVYDKYPLPPGY